MSVRPQLAPDSAPATEMHRVLATSGRRARVLRTDGSAVDAWQRRNREPVLAGDYVELEDASGPEPVIGAIAPRRNTFARGTRDGQRQEIAANLDLLLIVIAPEPAPTRDLINRYLVAAYADELSAALIINKADLASAADVLQLAARYQALGVPSLATARDDPASVAALRALIGVRSAVLVGMSGVGKSSLLNALVPAALATVGAISTIHGKGKHTTTVTTLHPLPNGGALLDSPGVWEYGLPPLQPAQVGSGFADFRALEACQFLDCLHVDEPGCQVRAAVAGGQIDDERYHSYLRILRTLPSAPRRR